METVRRELLHLTEGAEGAHLEYPAAFLRSPFARPADFPLLVLKPPGDGPFAHIGAPELYAGSFFHVSFSSLHLAGLASRCNLYAQAADGDVHLWLRKSMPTVEDGKRGRDVQAGDLQKRYFASCTILATLYSMYHVSRTLLGTYENSEHTLIKLFIVLKVHPLHNLLHVDTARHFVIIINFYGMNGSPLINIHTDNNFRKVQTRRRCLSLFLYVDLIYQ